MQLQTGTTNRGMRKGALALSVVLVVSGIILVIAISGATISTLFNSSVYRERLAVQALYAARSGAEDAIMRILRYAKCPNATYCPSTYTLTLASGITADVTIKDTGTVATGATTLACSSSNLCIVSVGKDIAQKRMVASLGTSPTTGELQVQLFREYPL